MKKDLNKIEVINHRLAILEGELGNAGAAQEKNELLELRALLENNEPLTEAQEDYITELVFWFENENENEHDYFGKEEDKEGGEC